MFIHQVYTKCLAQASYYVESEGIAAIIDPMREADAYIELASKRNARIKYVLVSHFHADFVSGHIELAKRTGAIIVFGPLAKPDFPTFIAEDGERIKLGLCQIQVLHTPGHTLESASFLLYNEKGEPHSLFSGDTLFIGDVGRPDLLSGNLDAKELAGMLYDSIQSKIKPLPDSVILYPGHGAGSACGKNLGKETVSTIGEQKRLNYAMNLNKQDFIAAVILDQPLAPSYFFKDAAINKAGYDPIESILNKSLKHMKISEALKFRDAGTLIVDTRPAIQFGPKHIKGSVNIGLEGQFAVWAGTILPFDQPLILLSQKGMEKEALIRLARVGYENVTGFVDYENESELSAENMDCITTVSIDNLELADGKDIYKLIDVRKQIEYDKDRMPFSINIPLELLNSRMRELDKTKHYAIYCEGGYRSMIAASMLKRNDFDHILNIEGGMSKIRDQHPELVENN